MNNKVEPESKNDRVERNEEALYADALRVAREEGRASPSLLQRKLNIGYAQARALVDRMEEEGYVSPPAASTESAEETALYEELMKLFTDAPDDSDCPAQNDPLYPDALRVVVEEERASVSLLQRKLTIGYGRAARLLDGMIEDGYVSSPDGSSASRKVLLTPEQLAEKYPKK